MFVPVARNWRRVPTVAAQFAVVALSIPAPAALPVQDGGGPDSVIRRPKAAATDASAQGRAVAAVAALQRTLTIKQTSGSAYGQLIGTPVQVDEGVTAIPVLMRVDRDRWNTAAAALVKELGAVGRDSGNSPVAWRTWGAVSKEGARDLAAFRAKLRELAGPGFVSDAIAARKDALGTWMHWITYDTTFTASLEKGFPFVTATISMIADGSPLSDAGGMDRVPALQTPMVAVCVLADVADGKGTLRRFEVPAGAAQAMFEAGLSPLAVQVRAVDESQKPLRSSVAAMEVTRPFWAQWVRLPVGKPNPYAISQESEPALFILPGSFMPGLGGPMARRERFIEQMWIGLATIKLDDEEAGRAKTFELAIVPAVQVLVARASLGDIVKSPEWAAFGKEADALPEAGRFHVRAMMAMVEWFLASTSPQVDLEPVFEGLLKSLESPDVAPGRGRRRAPNPEEVQQARAVELRIAQWLSKQVRN